MHWKSPLADMSARHAYQKINADLLLLFIYNASITEHGT